MTTELINTPGQVRFYRGPWNAYWSTKPTYDKDTQTYDFTKADINKKYINAIYFITDTDDHVGELYLNGRLYTIPYSHMTMFQRLVYDSEIVPAIPETDTTPSIGTAEYKWSPFIRRGGANISLYQVNKKRALNHYIYYTNPITMTLENHGADPYGENDTSAIVFGLNLRTSTLLTPGEYLITDINPDVSINPNILKVSDDGAVTNDKSGLTTSIGIHYQQRRSATDLRSTVQLLSNATGNTTVISEFDASNLFWRMENNSKVVVNSGKFASNGYVTYDNPEASTNLDKRHVAVEVKQENGILKQWYQTVSSRVIAADDMDSNKKQNIISGNNTTIGEAINTLANTLTWHEITGPNQDLTKV